MKLTEILLEIENQPANLKKIKKFCDDWNAGNIYGNRASMKIAEKYLDIIRDYVGEHWGEETPEGKLVEYLHGSLVGVIEWTSFNGRDKEKGGFKHKDKI